MCLRRLDHLHREQLLLTTATWTQKMMIPAGKAVATTGQFKLWTPRSRHHGQYGIDAEELQLRPDSSSEVTTTMTT